MKIPKGKILIGEGQLQAGDEFYYADGERFPVPNNVIGMEWISVRMISSSVMVYNYTRVIMIISENVQDCWKA